VATERQIAANRANAARSTGPRSAAGKKRSAQNSFRYGLTIKSSDAGFLKEADKRAVLIGGEDMDAIEYDLARNAAEAQMDLERVKETTVALIHRVFIKGSLTPPQHFSTKKEERKYFNAMRRSIMGHVHTPPAPILIDPSDTMPKSQDEREAEATRRMLPELLKLSTYEKRFAGRRDRAIKKLVEYRRAKDSIN
jgi:hypothetical protein